MIREEAELSCRLINFSCFDRCGKILNVCAMQTKTFSQQNTETGVQKGTIMIMWIRKNENTEQKMMGNSQIVLDKSLHQRVLYDRK